ncbi:MAG: nucleotide-binding universal stress UspA family protein [Myxococcota bacterium]|jgi:nucleotide-binding universal stress UspA family protein
MDWLVAVDVSESAEPLLTQAVAFAAAVGATLHLRAVLEPVVPSPLAVGQEPVATGHWEAIRAEATRRLNALAASIPEPMRGTAVVRVGDPASVIVEQSGSHDLVVLGTHGRKGLERLFLGSVAERVVRLCARDVLVLRHRARPIALDRGLRVVAALDARDPSRAVAARLRALATSELHVVNVLPSQAAMVTTGLLSAPADAPGAHPHYGWSRDHLQAFLADEGLSVVPELVLMQSGSAADELAAVAQALGADLVVLDHHRRRGLDRLAFGSTAERLVRVAPCAVWVVHPEER